MLIFNTLKLRNFVLFEEEDFKFEEGITLIHGRNRVGKSLLLSPIRALLCGTSTDTKLPVGSSVELLLNKVSADGTKDRVKVITSTPKSSTSWEMWVNNQSIAAHRKNDAREAIDKSVGLTTDLFDVIYHLNMRNSPPLTTGTPASRMEWASNIFNLKESFNIMEENISSLLNEANNASVAYKYASENYVQPTPPDLSEIEELESEVDRLRNKVRSSTNQKELNKELSYLTKVTDAYNKRKTKYTNTEKLESLLQTVESQLKYTRKYELKCHEYLTLKTEYDKSKEKLQSLLSEINKKYRPKSPKDLNKQLRIVRKRITECENIIEGIHQAKIDYENYETMVRFVENKKEWAPVKKISLRELHERIDRCRFQIESDEEFIETMKNKHEGPCPECGNDITKQHKTHVILKKESHIKVNKTKLSKYAKNVQYLEAEKIASKFVDKPANIAAVKKELSVLNETLQKFNSLLKIKLVKPVKPEMRAEIRPIEELEVKWQNLNHDLQLMQHCRIEEYPPYKESVNRIKEIEEALQNTTSNEKTLNKFTKLNEKLVRLRLEKDAYENALDIYNSKKDELKKLKSKANTVRPLKVLKEAFGRNGLLMSDMSDSLNVLIQEINHIAPLLLDEKFHFDVEIGPRKLQLIVERNGRKSGPSNMSTSELRCWSLLFATAMIRLLPHKQLSDMIILDEMESNMDPVGKQRYAREFLPYLQTLVPKVMVISPLITEEFPVHPDRTYIIEKKNNQSTLNRVQG